MKNFLCSGIITPVISTCAPRATYLKKKHNREQRNKQGQINMLQMCVCHRFFPETQGFHNGSAPADCEER